MDRKYFTATDLGGYFHFSCQLALWKGYHEGRQQTAKRGSPGSRTLATFSKGFAWEERLVKRLEDRGLIFRFSSTVSFEDQVRGDPRNHFFVIGASFKKEELFKDEYVARGQEPVAFGTIKPDFIEIWKRVDGGKLVVEWHIIDAKSSKAVKTSHQMQVYFYWRALQQMLPPEVFVPHPTASIWLLNEESPTPFSPLILKPQIDSFLFVTLPRIISKPLEEVPWHLNAVCSDCRWQQSCRKRTIDEGTVSMIPDLKIEEATFLREVIQLGTQQEVTEIEELDSLVSSGLSKIEKEFPTTARRFRSLLGMKRAEYGMSPVLDAVIQGETQVLGKPVFQFPREEDYAVIISLVLDPGSTSSHPHLLAFDISVYHDSIIDPHFSAQSKIDIEDDFISSLARILTTIPTKASTARTQLYAFSTAEVTAINQIIVEKSLTSDDSEDIRVCIGAIVDMPLALLTTIQPELLDNALYRSWNKASKKQLEEHLADLGLDTKGNIKDLRDRLTEAMSSNPGPRKLPKVVAVHRAIGDLVAMPGPGFTTLQSCANHLLGHCSVPSDDELYTLAKDGKDKMMLQVKLRANGMAIYRLIRALRRMPDVSGDLKGVLLNDAVAISPAYPQLCQDPNLRKLIFMHEYEALLTLRELWVERADSSRPCPVLEFKNFATDGSWKAHFKLLEGSKDIDVSGDMKLFDWILVPLISKDQAELSFDDLKYFNCVFPVAKAKWASQPESIRRNLALAHPVSIDLPMDDDKPMISLQLYRSGEFKMVPGQEFRMLRRYVDFNLPKILRNFLEIDVSSRTEKSIFLRLLENPNQVGQQSVDEEGRYAREEIRLNTLYRQLRDLGNSDAVQLVFQRSQRRVMQSILKRHATIVWGPPGTGKTHTLALSTLYLLEILYTMTTDKVIVWMTAVTNAAIEIFVQKLEFLRDRIKAIPNLKKEWIDALAILRITSGPKPPLPKGRLTVAAGTVWQLWNWNEKYGHTANVLIIDEAGQMNVGTAALAMRWLNDNGRLIVAGDHLQLAPILKGVYPKSDCALFGSILHCLLRDTTLPRIEDSTSISSSPSEILFQLEENFRMNPQLCNFVELIYQKRFQPMQSRREIVNLGFCISEYLISSPGSKVQQFLNGMSEVMRFGNTRLMSSPTTEIHGQLPTATTLFLMNLVPKFDKFTPSETHVSMEAKVVGQLVRDLASAFTEETIFVVTPHRVQRSLVTKELTALGLPLKKDKCETETEPRIWVDTTERMQGSEADIVICLFSHTHIPSLRRDLDFLYNRPRLNVAISRAKTISIVISSSGVLNPPVEALVDKNNLEGYTYLKAFEARAWSFDQPLDLSLNKEPAPNGPTFSSQEYDDESWEENVREVLAELEVHEPPAQESSQASSNYSDPELNALLATMHI